ncbi:MAG: preprotein translocase subunit Tim44 [Caulobacter sp.]|nr:preprotein translocase subunit Tim44 [Caulobacter sp.]
MSVVSLVILAVLAAVVLYQLYAVLGRRVGRQPEDTPALAGPDPVRRGAVPVVDDGAPLTGLAALKAGDPGFDVGKFLDGARSAYELIVRAFVGGDREKLAKLLSPDMMMHFEAAIAQREGEDRTETVEFLNPPRADLESVEVADDKARAKVRFLGEYRSRTKGPEGEGVDDRRTAEIWTFERPVGSRDPNWILARVDAAEA